MGKWMFEKYLGELWYKSIQIISLIVILFVPLSLIIKRHIHAIILKSTPYIKRLFPLVFYLFIAISLYQVYQLAFTDKWIGDNFVDKKYNLAYKGISSLFGTNLMGIIYYLTPAGFILFLMAINSFRKKTDTVFFLLFLFLSIAWFMRVIIDPTLWYQYYYARYLLGEVIPYGLLVVSLYLAYLYRNKIYRVFSTIAFLTIILFSLYFSSLQLFVHEAKNVSGTLRQISKSINENDIVLLAGGHITRTLDTPLNYYYHLNTMRISNFTQTNWNSLFSNYGNIYVVSKEKLPYKNIDLVNTLDYYEEIMEHTNLIPQHSSTENHLTLFLYKVRKNILQEENSSGTSILMTSFFEKTNFFSDNNWTSGDGIFYEINYILNPQEHYLVLHTGGRSPYSNDIDKLKLKLYVNDTELPFVKQDGSIYTFELNKNTPIIKQIRIQSATFVPKEVAKVDDTRTLGVDVAFLEIKEKL